MRRAGSLRVALCYPNQYFVGMSNLGFHAVLGLLNAHPEVRCERAFLPDEAARRSLERSGRPLASLETGTPLRSFDVVAFSISFENDALHLLQMLRLSGIPLRAADRGARDPVVVLGGAAMLLNPEPLAPFADVVAVGEGEALVPALIEALLGASELRRGLEALSPGQGFYLPGRYQVRYHPDGTVAHHDGPGRVRRQRARPGAMALPQSLILTPHTELSMKFLVETSRGCPCMCRFCWAGYGYLPVRGFARRAIAERARQVRTATHRIGLISTAVCDHPEIDGILDDLAGLDYQVSVASLRLDDLRPELVSRLADTGTEGLTLAPECGSDRLRRVLNKPFSNQDLIERAAWIFESGVSNLKLYFMVGLPSEEDSDIEAIVHLVSEVRQRMLAVGRPRGRVGHIQVSVNPFVPKPGTPFQWLASPPAAATDAKLRFLQGALAKMPNVSAVCKGTRTGLVQAVLALGDRRVAEALERASETGMDLRRAMRETGLDTGFYVARARDANELLPWDVVEGGVSKDYLLRELEKSPSARLSPHCPEVQGCIRCGVCLEEANPLYPLPAKWHRLGAPPRYLREAETLQRQDGLAVAHCRSSPGPPGSTARSSSGGERGEMPKG